jgi:geranylgeranyl diphosphate synthase type II
LAADIQGRLEDCRSQSDKYLRSVLAWIDASPAGLREAVEYALLTPGKRIRPALALLAAGCVEARPERALPAGCAVEMVHAYSLVHDDLPCMDNDDLRRGLPTVHKKYGEALAILAGDALLTFAFQVLGSEYESRTAAACCRELAVAAGAMGMIGGQVEDLTWEGKIAGRTGTATIEILERVHSAKTGALIRASLCLGLLSVQGERAAGPDVVVRSALDEYGRCLGLVFQITDDLLDVQGQRARTGKQVGKDAGRGKLTYPGLLGVEESRRIAGEIADRAREALRPLGQSAEPLQSLVRLVLARDR